MYFVLLFLLTGDSHWVDWSEWVDVDFLDEQSSNGLSSLNVAICKKTNKLRSRKCNELYLQGMGQKCTGKLVC